MSRTCVSLALIGLLMPGCAVMGRRQVDHPIDREALAKVEPGMSKAEVTRLLGAPTEIIFSNKALDPLVEHAYVYEYENAHYTGIVFVLVNFGNMDEKRDRVIVWLTPDGKVEHVGSSLKARDSGYGFPFGE